MSAASCESGYIYQVYVQWPDVLVSSSNNPLTPATELLASRTIVSFLPLPLPAPFSLSLSLCIVYARDILYRVVYIRGSQAARIYFSPSCASRNDRWIWKRIQPTQDCGKKVAFVFPLEQYFFYVFCVCFTKFVAKWHAVVRDYQTRLRSLQR